MGSHHSAIRGTRTELFHHGLEIDFFLGFFSLRHFKPPPGYHEIQLDKRTGAQKYMSTKN
jgi:hypothetical protein